MSETLASNRNAVVDKLLNHMAWANQQIFAELLKLPESALMADAGKPDWFVGLIARHIVSSADWYAFRLSGTPYSEVEDAKTHDQLRSLAELGRIVDARLFEAAGEPEEIIVSSHDGREIRRARSTVIAQAIHHATEHRAQLVSALESGGFTDINLDNYDLWAYCDIAGE